LGADGAGFEDGFDDLLNFTPMAGDGVGVGAGVGAEGVEAGANRSGQSGDEGAYERPGTELEAGSMMEGMTFVSMNSSPGDCGNRTRGANFSIQLPAGWTAAASGDRIDGNLILEGNCARAFMGWFEDFGVDPEILLRQVVRAYRSGSLRFTVLEAEPGGAVEVDGQRGSTLNIYCIYGGQASQKRLVAWSSPSSGRIFYASFWSCSDLWEENLEEFEAVLASFRDEPFEGYAVLEPRSATFDGWGTVLRETLQSYHLERVDDPISPEVTVRVSLTSRREGGRVDQFASEEIVSSTRGAEVPSGVSFLGSLLVDEGYRAVILRRGGAFWVAVQGPEGRWQAISSTEAESRGMGILVGPEEVEWYRGILVEVTERPEPEVGGWTMEGGEAAAGHALSLDRTSAVKDCDPPRQVRLAAAEEVNLTWILELEDLLDRYNYSHQEADPGSFLRAQICWALLEREGQEALLVTGYEGHPLHPRMWVAVTHPGGAYLAVDPAAGDGGLGEIVCGSEYFQGIGYQTSAQYSCLHPDRGLSIDPETVRAPAPG